MDILLLVLIAASIGILLLLPLLFLLYRTVAALLEAAGYPEPHPLAVYGLAFWLIVSVLTAVFLLTKFVQWAWAAA